MSADPFAWRCNIADDFASGGVVLRIYRRRSSDLIELITGFDEHGHGIVETIDAAIAPPFPGIHLPYEALDAIAEAVKPGPSKAELARLEDALRLERDRVDRVLSNFTPRPPIDKRTQ